MELKARPGYEESGGAVKRRRGNSGFSLVELMVAILIIAISLFAILSMVVHTMSIRQSTREAEMAKEWVTGKIEEVRSRTFTTLQTTYPSTGANAVAFGGATAPTPITNCYTAAYAGSATPSELNNATGKLTVNYSTTNLVEIVATINWKARRGVGSYSLRSVYAR